MAANRLISMPEDSDKELKNTLLRVLRNLEGSYVISMTVSQFLTIREHIKFNMLTMGGKVVNEIVQDGPLSNVQFDDFISDTVVNDSSIEIHTRSPILVYVRLGEAATHTGIFSTSYPEKSAFCNWPNTTFEIANQCITSNGSKGDADYTLVPMSMAEFIEIESKLDDVDGLIIRGSSIATGTGIHGFALRLVEHETDEWIADYPSGKNQWLTWNHIVKVVTRHPRSIIVTLSKLRKGD